MICHNNCSATKRTRRATFRKFSTLALEDEVLGVDMLLASESVRSGALRTSA